MDTPIQRTTNVSSKKMELLKLLRKKEGITASHESTEPSQPILQAVARNQPLPLSYGQQRLWFLDQLDPGSIAYLIPIALRFLGPLDQAALRASIRVLIQRHEVLRTTFESVDGQLVQQITTNMSGDFITLDLSSLSPQERQQQEQRCLLADTQTPFDLASQALMRVRLFQSTRQEHLLLITFHHIVFDGWSFGVFLRELATLYHAAVTGTAAALSPLPIQYADYAYWQRSWLQGERLQRQLTYWKQQLQDAPAFLDLPTDYPRPPVQTFHGHNLTFMLPSALQLSLERISQQEKTTLFMTLLAAWQVLLSRYTGQEDLVVGSPVANRTQPEIENLIGFFVNTLALRADLSGNPDFYTLLRQVKEVALGAYSHQDIPFEQVVDAIQPLRDTSRSPLFQVMFSLETQTNTDSELSGLRVLPVETIESVAKFELSLFMQPGPDGLRGTLEYNTDLFAETTMQRLIEHWTLLLQDIVIHPHRPISQLTFLSASERLHLLNIWQGPSHDYKTNQCIHELFEAQVQRAPDAIALTWEDHFVSYQELNARANQLARSVQQLGVGPETLVGLFLPRDLSLLISLLAILKAGGAYMPLDPIYPAERLAFMLQDTQTTLILTQHALIERLPDTSAYIYAVDADATRWQTWPRENLPGKSDSEQLAYLIYTSGSTGRPKGVMIAHRNTSALLHWARASFSQEELAGTLASSSICFDVSVFELFAPLCAGGTVILLDNVLQLPFMDAGAAVTMICTVPSLLAELLRAASLPETIQSVNFAGEALSSKLVQQTYAQPQVQRVRNIYGPTEDTTYSTSILLAQAAIGSPPLGDPLPGGEVYLLDEALQPVPQGIVGELFLGGTGLARGYWQRPDITAERFIPHPFSTQPGARLYRTGDLGRYRTDGTLEYLGRLDGQVKIRGLRIELGEIATHLHAHPQVHNCLIVAQSTPRGEKELVAYLTGEQTLSEEDLRTFLQPRLPAFMVPAAFVWLETFPVLANGKINRRALPVPSVLRAEESGHYVAPRDDIERQLVAIWEKLLERSPIGITDNFFEAGGHSLLAVLLVNQVKSVFQQAIPLAALFQHATIQAFSMLLREKEQPSNKPSAPILQAIARDQPLPLSYGQQRLWFLDQLDPGSIAYLIPFALRFLGPLDQIALRASMRALIQRHEVLRTTFESVDGQLVQQITADTSGDVIALDLSALSLAEQRQQEQRWLLMEAQTAFDLATGPLLRVRLLQSGEQEHLLLIIFHHIIFDGWSFGVFLRELATLYLAQTNGTTAMLTPLPIQYADYAYWQRDWLQGERLQRQLTYWKQQLQDAPAFLDLPTDYPRPPVQTFHGHNLNFTLPASLQRDLEQISKQEKTTLFMTLLAAWQVLLSRYTGQEDLVVGSPIANRTQPEIEGLIGFFVNTLALRTDLSGNPSFYELLRQVKEVALGAYSHQDVPFEQVVDAVQPLRDTSRSPLFQVMFSLEAPTAAPLALPGLNVQTIEAVEAVAKFEVSLFMQPGPDGLNGSLEYNTDLFAETTMQRLIEHWTLLLQDIVTHPHRPISQLTFLSASERLHLLNIWQGPSHDYKTDQCIHELFEAQVQRTPDAVALTWEDHFVSYQELNARANQLARRVQQLGVGPETLVGLFLPRDLSLLISLLAILKAGGAYMPLDPTYPEERLAFMLQDTQTALILTQHALIERLPDTSAYIYTVDADATRWQTWPRENLPGKSNPEQLAYLIYTSGSTGRPKGVMIAHRNTSALLHWARASFSTEELAGTLASSSICFDVSVFELFAPLCAGGTVILLDNVLQLPFMDAGAAVTMVCTVPSLLAELLRAVSLPETIQSINFAGEALSSKLVQQTYAQPQVQRVRNIYGPTEDTTYSTSALLAREAIGSPPLGDPLPGGEVYLLDEALQPVPQGIVGELFLGGTGLARGYWQRPDITAERFIPHPFSTQPGARLYRTGDLGRYRTDGTLEYLGRLDGQVKIRGLRIELGEIATHLHAHPQVHDCLIVAQSTPRGEKELVAYLTGEQTLSEEDLRTFLQPQLPAFMVPAAFVWLETFPVLANGKINRRALPVPSVLRAEVSGHYVAPRDDIERQLVAIWEKLLERSPIGITDNFFEAGGHSLLAVLLVNQVKDVFQQAIPLAALFQNATIQAFALLLHKEEQPLPKDLSALVPIQTQGTKTPFIFIHPVGGEVLCYMALASLLDMDHPFYALRFPFLEEEQPEPIRMEDLVTQYIDTLRTVQPHGPYILGGWSLGGTIAYAIAQQLRIQGEEIASLVLIDSYAPATFAEAGDDISLLLDMMVDLVYSMRNSLPASINQEGLREEFYHSLEQIPPQERLRSIWERGREMHLLPNALTLSQMQQLYFTFRSNIMAVHNYTPVQASQRIILFKPDEGIAVVDDTSNGWNALSGMPPEIYMLPGNHYTLLKNPHVEELARQINVLF